MSRTEYIQQELRALNSSLGPLLIFIGGIITLALGILDYVVFPELFSTFLMYRVIAASLLFGLFLLSKTRIGNQIQFIVLFSSILVPSAMISLMVLQSGGHQSVYYAGLIIVFIFILGFIPTSVNMAIVMASLSYAVYLVPILLFDHVTQVKVFINNNVFLVASVFAGLAWRYYNYNLLIKKLSLEYDLSQEKSQLERHSTQLEDIVEERTRELNKSEFMLRSLFENANEGIIITDALGIILTLNQKACDIHGFDKAALSGTNIELLEADEGKQAFRERRERILAGEALSYETQHYRRDGSRITLDVSAKAITVDGNTLIQSFYRDMTEKKRLQEQLFQSQKMESIGVLVGGIAHDFNNMLGAILGHAELLHDSELLGEQERQRITIIESSARRATHLISRLLSFARQKRIEKQIVNLNSVVKDTIELLERLIAKKNITVVTELDYAIAPIEGDPNQLEQVVMNLMVNAMDAMPDGGSIAIRTASVSFSESASSVHPFLKQGTYTVFRISDTGVGIPDEIRQRIFDPFFTTKESGKGTGLGLSMVYGIVKEHHGVINVDSTMRKGTTFEIFLPSSDRILTEAQRIIQSASSGSETILVVDDEEHMLSFMKNALEQRGYAVLAMDNPVSALETFRKSCDRIDLVITDIIMPLVNGRELASHFRGIKPGIKTIAVSGYDFDPVGQRDHGFDAFLTKPFESRLLLSTVRKLLDTMTLR